MSKIIRAAIGAIALCVFGSGCAVIADHRCLGLWLCCSGALLGLIILVMALRAQRRFRNNASLLSSFMAQGDELAVRAVKDEKEFIQWKNDLDGWYRNCQSQISANFSAAHAALFSDLSEGGRYGVRGFNGEHMDLKNTLRKLMVNLKSILDGYLRNPDI